MRDANGNELAVPALRGGDGRPVAAHVATPLEEDCAAALRAARAELEQVKARLAHLAQDHESLAEEHEESLKAAAQIAEAYTALTAKPADIAETAPFPEEMQA